MEFYNSCYIIYNNDGTYEIFQSGYRINNKVYKTVGGAKKGINAYMKG